MELDKGGLPSDDSYGVLKFVSFSTPGVKLGKRQRVEFYGLANEEPIGLAFARVACLQTAPAGEALGGLLKH
jgi:hypothetical protein